MQNAPHEKHRVFASMTIAGLLRNTPLNSLETRIFLMHVLKLSRAQLITQSERAFTEKEAQELSLLFQRRLNGEPIAYIVGEREFFGLSLRVTPDVLIPRPDTELLVELALERLPQQGRVLDMGTGSGAIAIAIAHSRPDVKVTALDVSQAALAIAQENANRHNTSIQFMHSNWYEALKPDDQFDVIISNPPYIVAGDVHLSQGDLRFEPVGALTDGADGLSALRIITSQAASHSPPKGWLLMEHGYDQAGAVRDLLSSHDFIEVQSWQDLASIERVSGGRTTR